jgi:flavin-dependent dehydrogenase
MTHYIKTESGSTLRNKLLKSIIITIRELGKQGEVDNDTKDMIAFIILSLHLIAETIEEAVAAWEKRDYWLKADRFRLEWEWVIRSSDRLYHALMNDDWESISTLIPTIAAKCRNIKLTSKPSSLKIWAGAYDKLLKSKKKGAA